MTFNEKVRQKKEKKKEKEQKKENKMNTLHSVQRIAFHRKLESVLKCSLSPMRIKASTTGRQAAETDRGRERERKRKRGIQRGGDSLQEIIKKTKKQPQNKPHCVLLLASFSRRRRRRQRKTGRHIYHCTNSATSSHPHQLKKKLHEWTRVCNPTQTHCLHNAYMWRAAFM